MQLKGHILPSIILAGAAGFLGLMGLSPFYKATADSYTVEQTLCTVANVIRSAGPPIGAAVAASIYIES